MCIIILLISLFIINRLTKVIINTYIKNNYQNVEKRYMSCKLVKVSKDNLSDKERMEGKGVSSISNDTTFVSFLHPT